uniref:Uncharacterized protein n=1 Tax=Timspurckia oligopyrenoides TaxID=708627 RepID=A0A7S0ZJ31_9RHOD|mmetsp:Transcript_7290/g.13152  ORF Transcript_7290/g.13152 Transcript_7290/m.13152 type:complete len:332 (+) Transcript_7290:59-1054(+)|eukprot:CAMPEP_0182447210 /NCGR_PEP_ID=MMETSP1172-20130603/12831_1 /TAXON_ID=708627 /ORGANISM="Timspurckia oligopyrenoides, Strain CCMP3278" /LENGTH=331 /DNA_ID=CAMNT_0024643563 /DNA_START=51 /DNA_END=1046 /DNA_ORIENTATION=+
MSAFVGSGGSGFIGGNGSVGSRQVCAIRRVSTSSSTVMMSGVDPMWKTELTGGFPGGEAFYKKWISEGMTGDIPALDEKRQPKGDYVSEEEEYVPIGSTRGQQKKVDPEWKTELVGGFPGGEFFYKAWVSAGTKGKVPNLDEELQPGSTEEASAESSKAAKSGGSSSGAAIKPLGTGVGKDLGSFSMAEEAPDRALYEKYLVGKFENTAPMIEFDYTGSKYDRVGMSMGKVDAGFWQLYYPKSRLNKAPVIKIDYRPGAVSTASVSLSMDAITGPPSLPLTVPRKGDVVTNMVTDPSTGRLKLTFSVDGEAVNVYSDPRAIEKYEKFVARK